MFEPAHDFIESFNQSLESSVAEYLSEAHAIVLPRLQVMADRGTVTLRGVIDSLATKRSIVATVRRVPGVRLVIDDMEVPLIRDCESWQTIRLRFSPALARYFEERRQGLVSDSAVVWDS
ncbi:MAG: BON domain-containing protein [Thermoguttaceae bacterium]